MILRAVELSSAGVQVWIGTGLGIAIAVAVGLFFFQGTLRIPLHRFFAATSAILMVVAFQLALTGVHELSEAMWIPSSKTEMATIGPIVRNEVFFFVVILGAAALVVLREWFSAKQPAADEAGESSRAPYARMGISPAAALELCCGDFVRAVVLSFAGRVTCMRGRGGAIPAKTLVAQNNHGAHSAFRTHRFEPAFLHGGREWQRDPVSGDPQAEWRLCNGAGCLPDLRQGRISPGRPERDLPELRRGDLYSVDRGIRRLQSNRREIPAWQREK